VLRETSHSASGDVRPNPDVLGGGDSRRHDEHHHEHDALGAAHGHDHDVRAYERHVNSEHVLVHRHDHVEAVAPTVPSRAVVMNVGEHTGALVLASNEQRSGMEVEIHPVARPDARTHVWVLPREVRDGVVYAAIFPSLECGDYAVVDVDGSIAEVIAIPANRVTHATWL
jgi:hypothetical protein